jgi:hypothetical protein
MNLRKLALLVLPLGICACSSTGGVQMQENLRVETLTWKSDDADDSPARSSAAPPALRYFSLSKLPYETDPDGAPRWFMLGGLHN